MRERIMIKSSSKSLQALVDKEMAYRTNTPL